MSPLRDRYGPGTDTPAHLPSAPASARPAATFISVFPGSETVVTGLGGAAGSGGRGGGIRLRAKSAGPGPRIGWAEGKATAGAGKSKGKGVGKGQGDSRLKVAAATSPGEPEPDASVAPFLKPEKVSRQQCQSVQRAYQRMREYGLWKMGQICVLLQEFCSRTFQQPFS